MSIHNYKHQLERIVFRIEHPEEVLKETSKRSKPTYFYSENNKKTAISFKNYLLSENIGYAKVGRYLVDIVWFDRHLKKDFQEATKEDLRRVVSELNAEPFAEETKKGIKIMIRKLYRFIEGSERGDALPERVKWININIAQNKSKLPEELLTPEEIKKIIQFCKTTRDKCFVSVLAESGGRISEVGSLKIKNISFEDYGARIMFPEGKTGMRQVLLVKSMPYLKEWINQHPLNTDREASLWYNTQSDHILSYSRLSSIIKNSAKRAGITKRIYNHLFRHSRATELASVMPEAGMKQYLGWAQSSKMCGVYIHMNGRETDNVILAENGLEVKKQKPKDVLKNIVCIRCKEVNESTSIFCKKCGMSLNEEEANKIVEAETQKSVADDTMNKLLQDPEILELIKKKIKTIRKF
jgi:site-specific recombinase XerD